MKITLPTTTEGIKAKREKLIDEIKSLSEKDRHIHTEMDTKIKAEIAKTTERIREEYKSQLDPIKKATEKICLQLDALQRICPHKDVVKCHGDLYVHCNDCGMTRDDTLPAHF